jgi:hypothetical protein
MTAIGGWGGRSDDWKSQHARARARAAERLDGPLDAAEAAWLDGHLKDCSECAAIAADYAAQRLELRALREREPVPPRDLWARTAAAIERDSRKRPFGTPRRSSLRPYALLAGALVVAIAVGTLTSSQRPSGVATTTPGTSAEPVALGTPSPAVVAPTPLAIGPQEDVAFLRIGSDGSVDLTQTRIDEVCPSDATSCVSSQPRVNSQTIGPLASPETAFGSEGQPIVVVGSGSDGPTLFAVTVPKDVSGGSDTETPTETPPATASDEPPASADATAASETTPPASSATPEETPPPTATDEPSPTPSEAAPATVEIAHGLSILDSNAAYARDGSAFAFTAQPADGSHGPDIYVWTVGDDAARPVTVDHQSVFGSWTDEGIVGSSLGVSSDGTSASPGAFVVRDSDAPVALPVAGKVWRPAVDPSGATAVYWAGELAPDAEGAGWKTVEGNLVLGRWGDLDATPDPSAAATAPAASDQAVERHETTIASGPISNWDARWDETGTRLAVWIADPDDPTVGKLSLYVVDPFDGSIDLTDPPLRDTEALAGFSIRDGRLAWAAPAGSSDDGRVLILAWTADAFGRVESAPGDFVLVR